MASLDRALNPPAARASRSDARAERRRGTSDVSVRMRRSGAFWTTRGYRVTAEHHGRHLDTHRRSASGRGVRRARIAAGRACAGAAVRARRVAPGRSWSGVIGLTVLVAVTDGDPRRPRAGGPASGDRQGGRSVTGERPRSRALPQPPPRGILWTRRGSSRNPPYRSSVWTNGCSRIRRRPTYRRAGWKASTRSTQSRRRPSASTGCCSPRSTSQESAFSTAAGHLPRPELRRLLRRADAVQRDERPGHDLAAGRRLLHLRQAPGLLRSHDGDDTRRSTTTSTRSWRPRTCCRWTVRNTRSTARPGIAAYDYYGHDATGVSYADQVLARAIGWSQHGFCINCGRAELAGRSGARRLRRTGARGAGSNPGGHGDPRLPSAQSGRATPNRPSSPSRTDPQAGDARYAFRISSPATRSVAAAGAAEQAPGELRAAEVQRRVVLPRRADAAVHGDHRAGGLIEGAAGHRARGVGCERELLRSAVAGPAGVVEQRAPVLELAQHLGERVLDAW